jgi:hypothetical protein
MEKRSGLMAGMVVAGAMLAGSALYAQQSDEAWLANCREQRDQPRYCEVRPVSLPAAAALAVDARPNGGVQVLGGDQAGITGSVRIQAQADTEAEAQQIAGAVRVDTTGGTLRAEGPANGNGRNWSASFVLSVPRRLDLDVNAMNGPVAVEGVSGQLRLTTVNGPMSLRDLGGDVRARSSNGPLEIVLGGAFWDGAGLDAQTNNGPLRMQVPDGYSAQIDAGTVNGRLAVGVPVTVQGQLPAGRARTLTGILGAGGPVIRAHTTNGPVAIDKR